MEESHNGELQGKLQAPAWSFKRAIIAQIIYNFIKVTIPAIFIEPVGISVSSNGLQSDIRTLKHLQKPGSRKQNCELKYYLSRSSVLSKLVHVTNIAYRAVFCHFTMTSMPYELGHVILTSTLLPLYYPALRTLNVRSLFVGNFGQK